jgi:hypothetical protein
MWEQGVRTGPARSAVAARDGTVARSVVAGRRQGAAGELTGATRRAPARRSWAELTRMTMRRGGSGEISDNGVHWWGESSGGRWRWRHDSAVSVRKRKGEEVLNRGQQWQMGGSHREAVVALG